MSKFKQANELFNQGNYDKALILYQEIASLLGENSVKYNIDQCLKKLGKSAVVLTEKSKEATEKQNDILMVSDLYREIERNKQEFEFELTKKPLVSVIMTAHNTEELIESAVNSLLLQSYKNLEIIIVDDFSQDNTYAILSRLASAYGNVRVFRLNSNLGTYYAKNLGITKAKGEIVFFHDSDDVCHHERIELSVKAMFKHNTQAVRTAYARVSLNDSSVIKVNDLAYKLGLITFGVQKHVFNEIGYFNCTTKASDDEFFQRFKAYYGSKQITNVMLPLYYNTMRDDSLFADMVSWVDKNNITQKVSHSRANYLAEFTQVHLNTDKKQFKSVFAFPGLKDAVKVERI